MFDSSIPTPTLADNAVNNLHNFDFVSFNDIKNNTPNIELTSNMSSTLRGKHLHAQAREMDFNVDQWIKSQNEDQCTKELKVKVSGGTGVSVRIIEKIIKEGSAKTDKRFKSPEKKTK
ncbi:hypothetical protein FQA39_LY11033 [Lamprigera yunnana]|nr:hypothetical protein FQA39_LY11033 [Lamprigera yunnana]